MGLKCPKSYGFWPKIGVADFAKSVAVVNYILYSDWSATKKTPSLCVDVLGVCA